MGSYGGSEANSVAVGSQARGASHTSAATPNAAAAAASLGGWKRSEPQRLSAREIRERAAHARLHASTDDLSQPEGSQTAEVTAASTPRGGAAWDSAVAPPPSASPGAAGAAATVASGGASVNAARSGGPARQQSYTPDDYASFKAQQRRASQTSEPLWRARQAAAKHLLSRSLHADDLDKCVVRGGAARARHCPVLP
jgi:hypothetical protein